MILSALTRCWHCSGSGQTPPLPQKWIDAGVRDHKLTCMACKGARKLCMFCGEAPDDCICEENEQCERCDKWPWACRCL